MGSPGFLDPWNRNTGRTAVPTLGPTMETSRVEASSSPAWRRSLGRSWEANVGEQPGIWGKEATNGNSNSMRGWFAVKEAFFNLMFINVNLPQNRGSKYRNHVLRPLDMGQRMQSILISDYSCNFIIGYDKSRYRLAILAQPWRQPACSHPGCRVVSALTWRCLSCLLLWVNVYVEYLGSMGSLLSWKLTQTGWCDITCIILLPV